MSENAGLKRQSSPLLWTDFSNVDGNGGMIRERHGSVGPESSGSSGLDGTSTLSSNAFAAENRNPRDEQLRSLGNDLMFAVGEQPPAENVSHASTRESSNVLKGSSTASSHKDASNKDPSTAALRHWATKNDISSPFSTSFESGDIEDQDVLLQLCSTEESQQTSNTRQDENVGSLNKVELLHDEPEDWQKVIPKDQSHVNDDDDEDTLQSEGAEYFDEDEEEALQQILSGHDDGMGTRQLLISEDLSSINDQVLRRLQQGSQHNRVLILDRVNLRSHRAGHDGPELVQVEEEGEDPADIPGLSCESSFSSVLLLLERFEESLGFNTSISYLALNFCHPKVMESTLFGISRSSCRLQTLVLHFAESAEEESASYHVWEGLVEVLKNTRTLQTLFLGPRRQENRERSSVNWRLLRQGMAQNTTLVSLTIETTSPWNDNNMVLLREAVSDHAHLAACDLVLDERNPFLIRMERVLPEIENPLSPMPSIAQQNQRRLMGDSPMSPKPARIVKAVSEDTSKITRPADPLF